MADGSRLSPVIEWRKVPWSLWLYVLGSFVAPVWLLTQVSGPPAALVLFGAIVLGWALALLAGVRWLWIATVAIGALSLISNLLTGPRTWYGIAGGVIGLGLLLLSPTRRYFADQPPAIRDPKGEVASLR
jgi:hypothetical protein